MRPPVFIFNVYSRIPELEVNVASVRRTYPDANVWVYCNHERPPTFISGVDAIITGQNTGHHNGTRDAYNAFVGMVEHDKHYASIHADVWASDYRVYGRIVDEMKERGASVGFLDPGPTGAMQDPRRMGYYADAFVLRGDAYAKLFPILDELDGHEWIETILYRRVHELFHSYQIYDVPNTCGRAVGGHRDAPFVLERSPEIYTISGDADVRRRIESLTPSPYEDIFAAFAL